MRRTKLMCLGMVLALAFGIGCFGTAHSMSLSGAGVKFGFASPENADGTVAVGGNLEFEQTGSRFHLVPGFMYWKVNGLSDLALNGDFYYHFYPEGVTPYLGAGLGLNDFGNSRTDRSDVELGANLIGGVRMPAGNQHTFIEARYTVSDISHFALLGGITFHLH